MLRPMSARHQRNKGLRLKHAIQICLLAAVGLWLLYQIKHSHYKKAVFEEKATSNFEKEVESQSDFLNLSRKDVPPSEERGYVNETLDKGNDDSEVGEGEEQETKEESNNGQGKGIGDGEIDEQDKHKAKKDGEPGEESTEKGDKEGSDMLDMLDEEDHEGDLREAREEQYKRDDASSDVHHETQSTESETGDKDTQNPDEEQVEDTEENTAKHGNEESAAKENVDHPKGDNDTRLGTVDDSKGNDELEMKMKDSKDNTSIVVQGENEALSNHNLPMNETSGGKNDTDVSVPKLDMESISNSSSEQPTQSQLQNNSTAVESTESNNKTELHANSTATTSNNQMETQNNTTEIDAATNGVPPQNETVRSESVEDPNVSVDTATPSEDKPVLTDEAMEQTNKSNTNKNENASERGSGTDTSENIDAAQSEADGNMTAAVDGARGELNIPHNATTDEEKEALADPSTISNIENEAEKDKDDDTLE